MEPVIEIGTHRLQDLSQLFTPHLANTYSSLLNEHGTDVKVQQELLRHADIRTTMNIYTRAVPERLRTAGWFGFCRRRAQPAGLSVPSSSLVQVQVVQKEKVMAEACGSRTHHSTREGPNRRL